MAATPPEPAELETRIRAACRAAGLDAGAIEWLPAELSLRRFARVELRDAAQATLVARVESPEDAANRPAGSAPEPPHEPIRALLERNALPVPRRYGGDASAGIELLEDVGSQPLRDAPAAERPALYAEALGWLPRLQAIAAEAGVEAFRRVLDRGLIAFKAEQVISHGLPARGRPATPAESATLREGFAWIARELESAPRRLAHRDYQSANLFVVEAGPLGRLRMIDLQGAWLAPPEYDAVCLLCDSYVELPESEIESQAETLRAELPDAPTPEEFARRFDWLTLTRKGKDYARFVYAASERGDRRYLHHLPNTARRVQRAAARVATRDPALADLASLLAELPESPCVQ